jgi:uncharacterized SAM-dependent methyltransferase
MAHNLNINSQPSLYIPASINPIVEPNPEFYSIFSKEEIVNLINVLEIEREIPLKYSYKGRGGKIWNDFYLKYIIPNWYRKSNVEIDLLKINFDYLNGNPQECKQVNIIDVGAGNSYPVKYFINRLYKIGRISKYVALDISEELLQVSKRNFTKWFPKIDYTSDSLDIENSEIPKNLLSNHDTYGIDKTANIFLHLGVTIGNHRNRVKALKNLRNSMGKNDFLVFTNEIGANSQWNGLVRGGCDYHAQQIYKWIQQKIGIKSEDCELIRKYDSKRDSVVANIKFLRDYTIHFNHDNFQKNLEILKGEEVTIWRHHKYEMPELLKELKEAGLEIFHYSTNKYNSHIMVICKISQIFTY